MFPNISRYRPSFCFNLSNSSKAFSCPPPLASISMDLLRPESLKTPYRGPSIGFEAVEIDGRRNEADIGRPFEGDRIEVHPHDTPNFSLLLHVQITGGPDEPDDGFAVRRNRSRCGKSGPVVKRANVDGLWARPSSGQRPAPPKRLETANRQKAATSMKYAIFIFSVPPHRPAELRAAPGVRRAS